MKRFLALFLVTALTFSLAFVLGACGKDKETDNTTASVSDEDEAFSDSTEKKSIDEFESKVERSTGEHYSEEYEKLTLPSAVSTTKQTETKKNETTTKKNDTKQTTAKQSLITTTQATTATTKKETTTKKNESTSRLEINTDLFSQTEVYSEVVDNVQDEFVGFGGGVTPSEVPRPEVTYYDKYVTDVLASKNYTLTTQMVENGDGVTLIVYSKGDQRAFKGVFSYEGMAISFRYFKKDGKAYMVIPSMMSYIEDSDMGEAMEEFDSAVADAYELISNEELVYCGLSTGVGYVCEMYKNEEQGVGFNYYFNSEGLLRIETVVLSSGERTTNYFSIKSGIEEKDVFSIPAGYKKTDFEGFENGLIQ